MKSKILKYLDRENAAILIKNADEAARLNSILGDMSATAAFDSNDAKPIIIFKTKNIYYPDTPREKAFKLFMDTVADPDDIQMNDAENIGVNLSRLIAVNLTDLLEDIAVPDTIKPADTDAIIRSAARRLIAGDRFALGCDMSSLPRVIEIFRAEGVQFANATSIVGDIINDKDITDLVYICSRRTALNDETLIFMKMILDDADYNEFVDIVGYSSPDKIKDRDIDTVIITA